MTRILLHLGPCPVSARKLADSVRAFGARTRLFLADAAAVLALNPPIRQLLARGIVLPRLDWRDREDRSMLRHLPRLQSAITRLGAAPSGAAQLHDIDRLTLTQTERAACAPTLDHDS